MELSRRLEMLSFFKLKRVISEPFQTSLNPWYVRKDKLANASSLT